MVITPASGHAYITNRGQLTNNNGDFVPDIKLYTLHTNPAVFIADAYSSFVFRKSDNDSLTPDSLHRVDMSLYGAATGLKTFKTEQAPGITNFFYPHTPDGVTGNKSYYRTVSNNVYPDIDLQFYSNNKGLKFYFIARPGGDADNIVLQFDGATNVLVTPTGGLKIETTVGDLTFEAPHAYLINPGGNIVPMPWQAKFTALGNNQFKFDLRNYPHNMPLFIQVDVAHPEDIQHLAPPEWTTFFGGSGYDEGTDVAIDTDGNPYFCGFTSSSSLFPVTAGPLQEDNLGQFDAYIAKFGSAFGASEGIVADADKQEWTTYYGGSGDDKAYSITTVGDGATGRVFVTGYTESPDMLTYNDAGLYLQNYLSGTSDAFIIGLDNFSGGGDNRLEIWVSYFGGSGDENANAITTDILGNIYIAGNTSTGVYSSTACDAPVDMGFPACNISSTFNNGGAYGGGPTDAFIARFSSAGQLQWSSFYGGNDEEMIRAMDFDHTGKLYITGQTASTTGFPITPLGNYNQNNFGGGIYDAFIARFDASLTHEWCTYFGGDGDDDGRALVIDVYDIVFNPTYNIYIAGETSSNNPACEITCECAVPPNGQFPLCRNGYFQGPAFSGPGEYGGGSSDGFIARFDPSLNFNWGTWYGGNSTDRINGLDIDLRGNVYFTGQTLSNDPIVDGRSNIVEQNPQSWYFNQSNLSLIGPSEAFLGSFSGTSRTWSTYWGAEMIGATLDETSNAIALAIDVDNPNNAHFWYITGATNSENYNIKSGAINDCCPAAYHDNSLESGTTDAYMVRFSYNDHYMISVDDLISTGLNVSVFPNPASYIVTIQMLLEQPESISVDLYTITGQKIKTIESGLQQGLFTTTLDFSNFSNGIYFLQIKTDSHVVTKKIIKKD